MIDAILNEAEEIANSRNVEVVDWLLWRLEQSADVRSRPCVHCWDKLKYVTFKVAAHRIKRRMEYADVSRYSTLCRERERALEDAALYRQQYKREPCTCKSKGETYKQIGQQFLGGWRVVSRRENAYA